VLRTQALLKVTSTEALAQPRVLVQSRPGGEPAATPFDMLLAPDGDALFLTSADSGWLLRYPICDKDKHPCADSLENGLDDGDDDGELDVKNVTSVPLDRSWSKLPSDDSSPAGTAPFIKEPYRFECAAGNLNIPELLPIPNAAVVLPKPGDTAPKLAPAGLALDAFCDKSKTPDCKRHLLVADKSQPIVHVVDIDALAEQRSDDAILTPILSGAPTERIAVSPRVPVAVPQKGNDKFRSDRPDTLSNNQVEIDASAVSTQYVYATDARDGSVLVAQDGRTRNVSVNRERRSDRLDLGTSVQALGATVAISLTIITPGFNPKDPSAQWAKWPDDGKSYPDVVDPTLCLDGAHTQRYGSRLRGVFLAVGLSDGSVRMVNVHDVELAECRKASDSCLTTQLPDFANFRVGYDPIPVVRHTPRIGTTWINTSANSGNVPLFSPEVSPVFDVLGSVIGISLDGTTNDPRVSGLDCLESCRKEDHFAVSAPAVDFAVSTSADNAPDGGTASSCTGPFVCSLADPFVEPLGWQATYEATIPGTRGGNGALEINDGVAEFRAVNGGPSDVDFCRAGVLGKDDFGSSKHLGDALAIVAELPSDDLRKAAGSAALTEAQRAECEKLVMLRDEQNLPIAFSIQRSFQDHLQLEQSNGKPRFIRASDEQPQVSWDTVQTCFAGLPLTYEVHVRSSFLVQSSGVIGFHHAVATDAASKRCINDASARTTGRAYAGEPFDNGFVRFQIKAPQVLFPPLTRLNLLSVTRAPKTLMNGSDLGANGFLRGVLPVDLRYMPLNSTLYAVDITARGVMPVTFDTMPTLVGLGYTIQ
jgi:hypothetical protein